MRPLQVQWKRVKTHKNVVKQFKSHCNSVKPDETSFNKKKERKKRKEKKRKEKKKKKRKRRKGKSWFQPPDPRWRFWFQFEGGSSAAAGVAWMPGMLGAMPGMLAPDSLSYAGILDAFFQKFLACSVGRRLRPKPSGDARDARCDARDARCDSHETW